MFPVKFDLCLCVLLVFTKEKKGQYKNDQLLFNRYERISNKGIVPTFFFFSSLPKVLLLGVRQLRPDFLRTEI